VNDQASRDPHLSPDLNRTDASVGAPGEQRAPARLDASEILASVGEVLYRWDIASDVLTWSANAADVLLIRDNGAIASGRAYAQLLEPDNSQAPFDAIVKSDQRDQGQGITYRIQYAVRPGFGWKIPAAGLPGPTVSLRARTARSMSSTSVTSGNAGSNTSPAAMSSPASSTAIT